jgi:hypothetical protein
MARCNVALEHLRIRKNVVIDDASNEADAICQFKQVVDLPVPPEGEEWPITIDWFGAPPPTEKPLPVNERLPKTAAEAIEQSVQELPVKLESVGVDTDGTINPVDELTDQNLDNLKNFGLDDRQIHGLRQGNLLTTEAIVTFAKAGGKFDDLPGLMATDETAIKQAVKAAQHG